jgi:Ser-tRNA(Ala) deacylase AlaX
MSVMRLLESVHGHIGVLAAVALLHPAILMRKGKALSKRTALSVWLTAMVVLSAFATGLIIYPTYRQSVRAGVFAKSVTAGFLFETKEHALVTGNQLGTDKSRIDYQLDNYDPERMKQYEKEVNDIITQRLPVDSHFVNKEEAEEMTERLNTLKAGFPEDITDVRLLQIGNVDIQACGGTHVKNTAEIGRVQFIKFDNKGKNNRRVYYTVEP